MNLGDDVLDRIEQAAKAANPGVWSAGKGFGSVVSSRSVSDSVPGSSDFERYGGHLIGELMGRSAVAHAIQSQPSVVLAMVAEIRRLRAIDLRDRFAGQALQGLLANEQARPFGMSANPSDFSSKAYRQADAMLAERAKAAQ